MSPAAYSGLVAVWLSITLPYAQMRWSFLTFRVPPFASVRTWIAADVIIAVIAVTVLGRLPRTLMRNWWTLGMVLGGVLSWLALQIVNHFSASLSFPEAVDFIGWSVAAGAACGALAHHTSPTLATHGVDRGGLIVVAAVAWLVILRIAVLEVAGYHREPATLMGAELWAFPSVLLWSRVGSAALFKRAARGFWRLLGACVLTGYLVLLVSQWSLVLPNLLLWGHGGMDAAFMLLGIPGPGLAWGMVMSWVLWTARRGTTVTADNDDRLSF